MHKHNKIFVIFLLTIQMSALSCQPIAKNPSATADTQSASTPQNATQATRQTDLRPDSHNSVSVAQRITDFMPPGWFALAQAEGDLNGDNVPDAAAVFSRDNPQLPKTDVSQTDEALESPRLLVIALRDDKNQLRLAAESEKVILARRLGVMIDDPFQSLTIDGGRIKVEQWTLGTDGYEYTLLIRYQHEQWLVSGELLLRDRRKGITKRIRLKPMQLAEFDIDDASLQK